MRKQWYLGNEVRGGNEISALNLLRQLETRMPVGIAYMKEFFQKFGINDYLYNRTDVKNTSIPANVITAITYIGNL